MLCDNIDDIWKAEDTAHSRIESDIGVQPEVILKCVEEGGVVGGIIYSPVGHLQEHINQYLESNIETMYILPPTTPA